MEATGGFEPPNRGFADPRLEPLGYVAATSDFFVRHFLPDKIFSQVFYMVPRAGLEPARPYEHYALNVACLPISAPRHG
jgi:hypothetical protein